MKEFGTWAAFAAGLYVLQTSLLPRLSYHGVTTDLLLLMAVSFAFLRGLHQGALMGFLLGLMYDLSTGTFFGVHTLSLTLIAIFFGRFSDRVFKEQFFLPVMASVLATAFNYFILALLMLLLGYRFNLMTHIHDVLLPMFVYQLALAYPVHKLCYKLDKRFSEKK